MRYMPHVNWFYAAVLRARWVVLLALTSLTVWLGSALWPPERLLIDFSFEGLFTSDGDERERLARFHEDFGEDVGALAVVLVMPPRSAAGGPDGGLPPITQPETLEVIEAITSLLRARPELDPRTLVSLPELTSLEGEAITPRLLGDALDALRSAAEDAPGWTPQSAVAAPAEALPPALRRALDAYRIASERLLGHELYRGQVFSADGRAAAIVARFAPSHTAQDQRAPLIRALPAEAAGLAATLPPGAEVHVTGVPVIQQTYSDLALSDLIAFVPLTVVLVLLLLAAVFRDLHAVLAPMPGVAMATIWAIAVMQLRGEPINLVNNVTGVVVLVIGIADGVHVLARYHQLGPSASSKRAAIIDVMRRMTPVCFVTSLTTAVGFASLLAADIPTIRAFGGYVGLAVMLAFAAQMLMLPIMLSFAPAPRGRRFAEPSRSRTGRSLLWAADLVARRRRAVLVASGLAFGLIAVGLTLIDDNARALGELRSDHPTARALTALEDHLSGALVHAVVFSGRVDRDALCRADVDCATPGCDPEACPAPGCCSRRICRREDPAHRAIGSLRRPLEGLTGSGDHALWERLRERLAAREGGPRDVSDDDVITFEAGDAAPEPARPAATPLDGRCAETVKDPAFLAAVDDLAGWLRDHPEHGAMIARVETLADLVRASQRAVGAPPTPIAELERSGIHQLLGVLASTDQGLLFGRVTRDDTTTHLTIRARDVGTRAWRDLREDLEEELGRRLAAPDLEGRYDVHITGGSTLAAEALGRMVRGMGASLIWALLAILIITAALFRSLRVALVGMLPNMWPLLAVLALMGFAGITVRVSTVIVFSVALGIAVDDTIHWLHRYREELRAGRSPADAERAATVHTGRAIALTTIILVAGFSVHALSDFVAIQQFGALASLTLALAVVGDLIMLPALAGATRLDRAFRAGVSGAPAADPRGESARSVQARARKI